MTIDDLLVTGGAGFVGSHVAKRYADDGADVTVLDDLSRGETLSTAEAGATSDRRNWTHLKEVDGVTLVEGDVRDADLVEKLVAGADGVVHAAAQVAVTSSLDDPRHDLEANTVGTFNVLEAARKASTDTKVALASTNKVYGENVNEIPVAEGETRYRYDDPDYEEGIPETLSVDATKHTPYGTSKLAADLYAQDYAHTYGLPTGVFRMSCIYGTRQWGNEDQGWVAHFILSTLRDDPLTIFGDGKQVRDLLWVEDLVQAYDAYLTADVDHGVWNVGGGPEHTTSLVELLDLLEDLTGKRSEVTHDGWREGDQKVYVSDVTRLREDLGWEPEVGVREGVERFVEWATDGAGLDLD